MAIRRHRRRRSRRITPKFLIILILLIVAVLMGILAISSLVDGGSGEPNSSETQKPGGLLDGLFGQDTPSPTLSPTPSPTPEPTPTPIPDPTSVVTDTVDTTGAKWGYHSELEVDGVEADDSKSQWWCITKDGEQVNTGVDATPIEDGDHYELTLSTY